MYIPELIRKQGTTTFAVVLFVCAVFHVSSVTFQPALFTGQFVPVSL